MVSTFHCFWDAGWRVRLCVMFGAASEVMVVRIAIEERRWGPIENTSLVDDAADESVIENGCRYAALDQSVFDLIPCCR
ncbi:hypothetical protein BKH14_01340 [Actinomyces naeslundii]|nr:hypothetical protein BKH14_01340 [Actinomyces naeslundii]